MGAGRQLLALEARSGTLLWSRSVRGDGISGSPVPHGGVLYVAAGDELLALE